jgi:hypothetical protein
MPSTKRRRTQTTVPNATTVRPKNRKNIALIAVPFALILIFFLAFAGSSCQDSGNSAEQNQVTDQQTIYEHNQPIPTFTLSSERAVLIQLYQQRVAGTLNTWTVWIANNGTPLGMCASKGYPIPYGTELTNPWQVSDGGNSAGTSTGNVSVGQMDPNGIYPAPSTLGTWVMCLDTDGSVHPQYIEPLVMTYTHPVRIQNGQIVDTGTGSSTESTVQVIKGH